MRPNKEKESFDELIEAASKQSAHLQGKPYNPRHAKRRQRDISTGEYLFVAAVALIVILGILFLG